MLISQRGLKRALGKTNAAPLRAHLNAASWLPTNRFSAFITDLCKIHTLSNGGRRSILAALAAHAEKEVIEDLYVVGIAKTGQDVVASLFSNKDFLGACLNEQHRDAFVAAFCGGNYSAMRSLAGRAMEKPLHNLVFHSDFLSAFMHENNRDTFIKALFFNETFSSLTRDDKSRAVLRQLFSNEQLVQTCMSEQYVDDFVTALCKSLGGNPAISRLAEHDPETLMLLHSHASSIFLDKLRAKSPNSAEKLTAISTLPPLMNLGTPDRRSQQAENPHGFMPADDTCESSETYGSTSTSSSATSSRQQAWPSKRQN